MTDVVDALRDMLTKAEAGELSTVVIIGIRRGVRAGECGYLVSTGAIDADNSNILDSLRLLWQGGFSRWRWPALGVDQGYREPPTFGRKYERRARRTV